MLQIKRKSKLLGRIIFCLCLLSFSSCSNDGRLVKKFIKRVNAKEVSSASKYVYIKKSPVLKEESLFFSLGLFDGLSLLVAVIILVVIAFPLIFIGSIVEALFNNGIFGIIVCVALTLGLIYTAYQLLENILFELFLINLPY
jgi:hypothetical protein